MALVPCSHHTHQNLLDRFYQVYDHGTIKSHFLIILGRSIITYHQELGIFFSIVWGIFEFKAISNVGVLVEYLLLILWSNLFIDTNGFIIKIDERKVQFQWYRRNYISQKDLKLDCFFCNTLFNHFWNLRRLLLMILIHKHFIGLGKMRDIHQDSWTMELEH